MQRVVSAIASKRTPIIRVIQPGDLFKHYKNNLYRINCISTHTETEETLINYHNVSSPEKIWSRPEKMFNEYVEINGDPHLRFVHLHNKIE